ncbi:MAG TPA: zinc dependent phospholipase C family protein [Terriglobia bacterium]|nr:zinc dependent phospholipase C family protein [Terriglobia bacterium]
MATLPRFRRLVLLALGWLAFAPGLQGYSVLSHEALIDAAWDPVILPMLRRRFPGATPEQLDAAHSYAYGGCVIQDMGYYPLGNHYFSNLTHYVRAGDFILALIEQSRNLNEYAFALGALSHYVADNVGHPLAVNLSVPDMYPKLRREYGPRVTYEDDPTAHIMTEFSFDVVQVIGAGYLPKTYHNYIGFQVPKGLLERAFQSTYGLKLSHIFFWEGLSLKVYRAGASEIVPSLGDAVWRHDRKKLLRVDPQLVQPRFGHHLSAENYERQPNGQARHVRPWTWHWKQRAERTDLDVFSQVLVSILEVLPKVGSLRTLEFKPPTVPVQEMFVNSFDVTVARYESDVTQAGTGTLTLPDANLDIGRLGFSGQYALADKTYARLLNDLSKHHYRNITPGLRDDILAFYRRPERPAGERQNEWQKTMRQLAALRGLESGPTIASR